MQETIGQRIKALREARHLTQRTLAAHAGISDMAISLLETGQRQPRYATLVAIARALGVPLTALDPDLTPADVACPQASLTEVGAA